MTHHGVINDGFEKKLFNFNFYQITQFITTKSKVRVPYSTVGLIVGPKGATIKHIQRTTKTTIKSPDRGAESIFEIIGL